MADAHGATTTFPFYGEGVHGIARSAAAYERHMTLTSPEADGRGGRPGRGRSAGHRGNEAALVGRDGGELCQEPTPGRLHEALSVPVADLVSVRDHDPLDQRMRTAQQRRSVDIRSHTSSPPA